MIINWSEIIQFIEVRIIQVTQLHDRNVLFYNCVFYLSSPDILWFKYEHNYIHNLELFFAWCNVIVNEFFVKKYRSLWTLTLQKKNEIKLIALYSSSFLQVSKKFYSYFRMVKKIFMIVKMKNKKIQNKKRFWRLKDTSYTSNARTPLLKQFENVYFSYNKIYT